MPPGSCHGPSSTAAAQAGPAAVPVEQRLAATPEQLRLFIEYAPVALAMFDREMRYISASRRWLQDFGLGERELFGLSHYEVFPEIPEEWKAIHRRCLSGEVLCSEQDRFVRADGSVQWIRWEVRPWRDVSDNIGGMVIFSEDITSRVETEERLRAGTADLQTFLDTAATGLVRNSRDLRYLAVNPAYAQIVGRPVDQIVGRTLAEVLGDKALEKVRPYVDRVLAGERVEYELELPFAVTGPRWIHVVYTPDTRPDGEVIGWIGSISDRTEQKRAEQSLRESEERFQALADNIAQLAWIADGTGHIFWYNRRWYEYTGTTLEEMEGWGWKSVHHPDHIDRVVDRWSAHLRAGEFWEDTFPLRSKHGEYRRFLSRAFPIRDEQGVVVRWCGTNTDVEDLERAEDAARQRAAEVNALNTRLQRAMSETHHRVKNNLQVVSALIDMQVMDRGELVPAGELTRIGRNIRALAALHDALTQQAKADAEVEHLRIATAMEKLKPLLQSMVGGRELHFKVEDVYLPVRQTNAVAMIVSELLANAVKHGAGEIGIAFYLTGGTVRLEVRDNGPGFPTGFHPQKSASIGLELVESLARWDLGGTTHYRNRPEGGAQVVLEFPLEPAAESSFGPSAAARV